jgi:hypothetical protein
VDLQVRVTAQDLVQVAGYGLRIGEQPRAGVEQAEWFR